MLSVPAINNRIAANMARPVPRISEAPSLIGWGTRATVLAMHPEAPFTG
jgi:hypothetical protein